MLKPGFIARAQVLRKERGPFRGGYRYKYGCRFMDISGKKKEFSASLFSELRLRITESLCIKMTRTGLSE